MRALLPHLPPPPPGKTGWPWTVESDPLPPTMPDGKPWPKISIVTPSYNQGQFIEETIRSVLLQNYPNLEYIIIDGGSTDESVEIIRKYEPWLTYWVSEKDRGQSHAINKGLALTTGELMTFINSDDWYMPSALDVLANLYEKNPDAGVFVGSCYIINNLGKVLYCAEPNDEINLDSLFRWLNGGNFYQPSSAFTRKAWESAGPFDENVHIAFDLEYWIRIAKCQFRFVTVRQVLSRALQHSNAKTTEFILHMRADIAIVIIKHGGERHVREVLDEMATKLEYYETNFTNIMRNKMVNIINYIYSFTKKPLLITEMKRPPWLRK